MKDVIAIVGCTASGKAALGRALARAVGGELLSVDSMKVYRGMDVGTAKPSAALQKALRHHLVDVIEPHDEFSAARFVELADAAVAEIHSRGKPVVAVGGTVMYLKFFYQGVFDGPSANAEVRARIRERAAREGTAVLHDELRRVDPDAAERIHPNDLKRIERALEVHELTGTPISVMQRQWSQGHVRRSDWRWTLIGLRRAREDASRRINERVKRMIADGLVEEAHRLWSGPRQLSETARQAVGYAELFAHFEGALSLDDAIERIKINSRRLAKAQRTALRQLTAIHWIELTADESSESALPQTLALLGKECT